MHPKDADGMANSVDPDQTAFSEAVWSWSALFAETYLSQYIEFLRYVSLLVEEIFCLVCSLVFKAGWSLSLLIVPILKLCFLWFWVSYILYVLSRCRILLLVIGHKQLSWNQK